jgi:hypothetical protein
MATRLTTGKAVKRVVASSSHDARKRGALVITVTGTGSGAVLELRPLGKRRSVSVTVDTVYLYAVKLEADFIRREKAAAKKAKAQARRKA